MPTRDAPTPPRPPRSAQRIAAHYHIEKALAARLRAAPPSERRQLYRELYDELFRRVPDHSQLANKAVGDIRARSWRELRLVEGLLTPGASFLELGAGDCQFALEIARRGDPVYALDVSREIVAAEALPPNFTLVLSDGTSVPLAPDSIDLAYSNQLIEHLHPDDLPQHLEGVRAALKPGGRYVIQTPHCYTGPHDISRGFDDRATGFHLHEYRSGELCARLHESGFTAVRQLVGARGHYLPVWPALPDGLETLLSPLPARARRALGELPGLRMVLHRLIVIATRPH